jgi:hypothetical protein
MEQFFTIVTLALFAAAMVTMHMIVRDSLPYLDEQDRASFRAWANNRSCWRPVNINRALRNAWSEHRRVFPKSRKYLLFACFVMGTFVALMAGALYSH